MANVKRKECPNLVTRNQELALSSTIYILRNMGPLGFCLKEEGENKEFKVFIGSRHTCTCAAFQKERDLCRHICWTILKRLKISKDDPISFQLGLNDREIEAILTQTKTIVVQPVKKQSSVLENSEPTNALRKQILPEDVCPICQENFFEKHWPITYCRNGCGNNVHIRCMKIWADHQIKDFGTAACEIVKCPYCRGEFCSISQLKKEYRNDPTRLIKFKKEVSGLSEKKQELQVNDDYETSEITENKEEESRIEEKLQKKKRQLALNLMETIPSHVIPTQSQLLVDGVQCCLCLKQFQAHEFIGRLACRHRFHKTCLINWFTENQPICPIDKIPVEVKAVETTKVVASSKKSSEPKDSFSFLLCGRNLANEPTSSEQINNKKSVLTRPRRNRNFNSLKSNSEKLFLDCAVNGSQFPVFGKNRDNKYCNVRNKLGNQQKFSARESKVDFKKCNNLSTEFALFGNKLERN